MRDIIRINEISVLPLIEIRLPAKYFLRHANLNDISDRKEAVIR